MVAEKKRLLWLDGLRGIAIILVMLTHISQVSINDRDLNSYFAYGQYGVQIFFVISAITCILTLKNNKIIKEWYIKRLVRISLIYYFGIILYYIVFLVMQKLNVDRYVGYKDAENIIANILYLHAWIPSANNSVVPGGWSIAVEVFFYIIAPFFILSKWNFIKFFLPILIFLIFLINYNYFKVENNTYYYYWPFNQIPLLLTVVYAFRYLREKDIDFLEIKNESFSLKVLGFFLIILGSISGVYLSLDNIGAPFLFGCGVFIYLLGLKEKCFFENNFLVLFGRLSFSLYIIHFLCIDIVRFLIKFIAIKGFYMEVLSTVFVFVFVFVLSFILAIFCHHYVEKKYEVLSNFLLKGVKKCR